MLTHYAVNVDTIIAVYSSSKKVKKLPNMFQLSSSKESSGVFSFPLSPNSLINVRDKTTQLLLWAAISTAPFPHSLTHSVCFTHLTRSILPQLESHLRIKASINKCEHTVIIKS